MRFNSGAANKTCFFSSDVYSNWRFFCDTIDGGFNTGAFFVDRPLDHPKCATALSNPGSGELVSFPAFLWTRIAKQTCSLTGVWRKHVVACNIFPSTQFPSGSIRAASRSTYFWASPWLRPKPRVANRSKSWQLLLCDAKDSMYIYIYIYVIIYNYIYIYIHTLCKTIWGWVKIEAR